MKFPENFSWGAATASYQIEGAYNEDGRTMSWWDTFSHIEGNVANNENGDIACNHYHHLEEDVALMKEMGLKAYRFSISWSRLFPNIDGAPNPAGFAFYDKLVNLLIENDIEPAITLFHWDLPQYLADKGGFLWEGISDVFAKYSKEVTAHFSDRVEKFITINEPQCIAHLGYCEGLHAPGSKLSNIELALVMRNLLLCHGKAVIQMRNAAKRPILIGTATTGNLVYPINNSNEALDKARELSFSVDEERISFSHNWYLDPIVLRQNHLSYMNLSEEDMDIINQPIDFMGVNVYNGKQCDENGYVTRHTGWPRNALGWPHSPKVMHQGLMFLYERYNLPIYITENGCACNDRVYVDGKVHDMDRIDFLLSYLVEMKLAMDEGCDIRGYWHWSLMDNFEWHSGYDPRFGLIYVDYSNDERIWKDSAYWYKDVIANNGWE